MPVQFVALPNTLITPVGKVPLSNLDQYLGQGEGHHCNVYIRVPVVVNMSLDRQCPRKGPGNFLGETKKAFRESCVEIAY